MKRLALPTILLAVGALLASGCVYKMNIQQGNYLVADSVSQLKEGMTRSQVRFLLGTPMVPDAFDDDRWDYYYFFSSQKIQGTAQASPDCLFRGRQGAALRKPGRADPGRSRAARTRSAQGQSRKRTRARSRASGGAHPGTGTAETPPRGPAALLRRPRRLPIRCRLPRLCPLPPGLLRVSLERPVDLDPVAVARHGAAIAQLAEDSDVCVPRAPRRPAACARACASASATVAPSGSVTCHSHCRSGVAMPRCSVSSS